MAVPDDIPDAIEQSALGPKRVQVGDQSVEQHSIKDLIAADNHQQSQTAKSRAHMGLRFTKIIPPGAG